MISLNAWKEAMTSEGYYKCGAIEGITNSATQIWSLDRIGNFFCRFAIVKMSKYLVISSSRIGVEIAEF